MYEDADEVDSVCSFQNENVALKTKVERRPSSLPDFPHEVEIRFASKSDSARQRMKRYVVPADNHLDADTRTNLKDSVQENKDRTTNTSKNNDSKQLLPNKRKWKLFRQILCIDCC